MNRSWTKRGCITENDKILIAAIVKENPVAARVFVTGEVYEDYLGDIAAGLLYAANDAADEPLFVQTKDMTVQMTRFDPQKVWKCFNYQVLEDLLKAEEERLGMENIALDEWDFYASMIASLQMDYGGVSVPVTKKKDFNTFYQVMYLGCLWLYGKAGYMSVHASRHFALPETALFLQNNFSLRALTETEMDELEILRKKYQNISGITNSELNFLLKLINSDNKLRYH